VLDDLPVSEFGFPGPLRDELVAAILSGAKTSTTGLHEEYVRSGDPLPAVGERSRVVDSVGVTVAVIESSEVAVRRLGEIDLAFAIEEGEGFETIAQWREAHVRFFESPQLAEILGDPPVAIDDDTLVVCERFRLVEKV
jgi:uncharacterized protein YhfF